MAGRKRNGANETALPLDKHLNVSSTSKAESKPSKTESRPNVKKKLTKSAKGSGQTGSAFQAKNPIETQPKVPPSNLDSTPREKKQEFDATNFVDAALRFKAKTGLDLVQDHTKKASLIFDANGQGLNLCTFEMIDSELEEAMAYVTSLIPNHMEILSQHFDLEFSQPGESNLHQFELDAQEQYVKGRPLTVRLPRWDELKALQKAIEFSWGYTRRSGNEKPIRVEFIDGTLVKGEEIGVRLKFLEDGRPLLFITPALCERGVPTELDRRQKDHHESWQVSIMRELAWKSAADARLFPLHPDDYSRLGWSPIMTEEYAGLYAMKTKAGELFAPYEDGFASGQEWARCDHNGVLLNSEGEPAMDLREVAFLSNKEMSKFAEIKPCGEMFFSAEEEIVDALRCYRQSQEWRIHLELYCPELYRAVRSIEEQLGNEESAAI